jgi:hypothetical protein
MKLFFCFDGDFDEKEGMGEGWIAKPKYAFRSKEACERFIASILATEGDEADYNGYKRYNTGSVNVAGNPSQVYELVHDVDDCTMSFGLFVSKAQAEARIDKLKRDAIRNWGEEMESRNTIYLVEVLDEFIE